MDPSMTIDMDDPEFAENLLHQNVQDNCDDLCEELNKVNDQFTDIFEEFESGIKDIIGEIKKDTSSSPKKVQM